jgi:hypothetical protein
MANKRNAIERTLRKAQSVLASYIKPGRRSAEASIDELLRVLHDTRVTLMRTAKKTGRAAAKSVGAAKRRVGAKRASVRRTAPRKSVGKITAKRGRKVTAKRGRKRAAR